MEALILVMALQVLGGIAALALSKWARAATLVGAGGTVLGCLAGLVPTLNILLGATPESLRFAWDAMHGVFAVEVDALGAFFLLPVLVLSTLAAVYGGNYLLAYRHEKSLGAPWFFFNLFVAGMILVVIARTVLLFLMAWEVMSVAAFFLVTFEHEQPEVRKAGWVYLIATHLGVAFLFLAFLLLGRQAGSLEFEAFRRMPALGSGWAGVIFLLALVGFGTKAGFVPFHVWLPEAHPAAPSHVSALMSGVMNKLGLYGMLRVLTFLGQPDSWWGPTLAGLGLFTGLFGVALALQQRDLKRLLAYSSIENMGLIGLALGIGLWGWASNLQRVAALGMTAGLLHIWNHSLMKGLMFFAAGSVVHGTGTKDMEKLGGLMKRMPWTGITMVAGAVAISGLPPMNGFVSEWLMYLGLLNCGIGGGDRGILPAFLAIGLLSLIGGLAVVVFVRLVGVVLLGSARAEPAEHAHESSPWMLGPMILMGFLCLAVAVVPQTFTGCLSSVLVQMFGSQSGQTLSLLDSPEAPLAIVGSINALTLIVIAAGVFGLVAWSRQTASVDEPTWGCGYLAPTARMQYTGMSFVEIIAEHLLPRFLQPRNERHLSPGLFPSEGDFRSESPDPVDEQIYEPFFLRWADRFSRLRILQQGKLHVYLVYILVVVVLALTWVSLRSWWPTS
jgi:formate hydrogenlyase subunit 3/multisubunit Na+/H+ antiporter MnhD subunit